MARTPLSPQDLQNIRALAAQWGRIVSRRAFGEAGPGLDLDFTALEQLAAAAAAGLTEGTLAAVLEQQAQALGQQQPCPDCGRPCAVRRQARPLHIDSGQQIRHQGPFCHCPDCRRDFFPPKDQPASGQPQLQPRPAAEGR
jgi:hypothetical protein